MFCDIIGWDEAYVQTAEFKAQIRKLWKAGRRKYYPWTCQCGFCDGDRIKIKPWHSTPSHKVPIYRGRGWRVKNLTGEKFGHWLVLRRAPDRGKRPFWWCICDCGNKEEYQVEGFNLRKDRSRSCCKCHHWRIGPDITGEQYGRLTVIEKSWKQDSDGNFLWKCSCSCDVDRITHATTTALRRGKKKSCGCLQEEIRIQMKDVNTPSYNVFACNIIEEYGKKHGYDSFQHAENGGEFKVLKYYVDGYDAVTNTVIEVDEPDHYRDGKLRLKDIQRQRRIMNYLRCTFIRIRVDGHNNIIGITIYKPGELPELYPDFGIVQMIAA